MDPTFTSVPLVQVIKEIGFLEGNLGRQVFEEYNNRVGRDYRQTENQYRSLRGGLEVLDYEKRIELGITRDVVIGSSSFGTVLVDEILREIGLRTATRDEILTGIESNLGQLAGASWYTHAGLILRSEGEPNSYLATDLVAQLRARDHKLDCPILIHFKDLSLKRDDNSPYGLTFKLNENPDLVYDETLNVAKLVDCDIKLSGLSAIYLDCDMMEQTYNFKNDEPPLDDPGTDDARIAIVKVLPSPIPMTLPIGVEHTGIYKN